MTVTVGSIQTYESTRRWLASRASLWGSRGDSEEIMEILAQFCEIAGKNPDDMVDECLRRSIEGGPFVLRTRARKEYIERIERFEADTGSRDAANAVRSFFIHNGVAMSPSILP
jgi:hypothetical protein